MESNLVNSWTRAQDVETMKNRTAFILLYGNELPRVKIRSQLPLNARSVSFRLKFPKNDRQNLQSVRILLVCGMPRAFKGTSQVLSQMQLSLPCLRVISDWVPENLKIQLKRVRYLEDIFFGDGYKCDIDTDLGFLPCHTLQLCCSAIGPD